MLIKCISEEGHILFKAHHMMSLLTTDLQLSLASSELLATTAVGAVTFPTVLALSQSAIFKPLRITCASRLAPVFGGLSVSLAGFTASFAAIKAYSLIQDSLRLRGENGDNSHTGKPLSFSTPELVISTVSSVVIFRALGGRFSSVLPSHLFHPGAFAVERVPALRGQQPAVASEKVLIREYGRKYGCHSCGRKRVNMMVCDHQPPSYILRKDNNFSSSTFSSTITGSERNAAGEVKADLPSPGSAENGAKVKQFFYPQCYECSSMQGGLLNGGPQSKLIITHPFSLRLYHLFLPLPFTIAYLKSTLQDEVSVPSLAKLAGVTTSGNTLKTFSSKTAEVAQEEKVEKSTQTPPRETVAVVSSSKNSLRSFIQDSDIS